MTRRDEGQDDMNQEHRSLQDLARYARKGGPRRGVRHGQARPIPEDTAWSLRTPQETEAPAGAASLPRHRTSPMPDSPPQTIEAAPMSLPCAEPAAQRGSAPAPALRLDPVAPDMWSLLREEPLDEQAMARNRLISAARTDPAHAAFEVLRTRLMQALSEQGWSRVAITSPTKDCGKSFVAANLALSFSRHETARTVLMDMDLRNPSLARLLSLPAPGRMSDFLTGRTQTPRHFLRFGPNRLKIGGNLAMGLNDQVETYASELLQLPATSAALGKMHRDLRPDVVLFDLPPALYHDDVLAFSPEYDGVLLVVGGGITRAEEIREVSRRLSDHTPLLGVVLNRAEGPTITNYSY